MTDPSLPTRHTRSIEIRDGKGILVGDNGIQVIIYQQGDTSHQRPDGAPPEEADLGTYLRQMTDRFRWLELQGIREAGSLRIELEKVYIALKAEPETDYDLLHQSRLHDLEVRVAAGGTSLDSISPDRLAALDAENVRRAHQPRRDQHRRDRVIEVSTLADVIRAHRRVVLLGGPGTGKTTLGKWLALQSARESLRQLPGEVQPVPLDPVDLDQAERVHVRTGGSFLLSRRNFVPPEEEEETTHLLFTQAPNRGMLTSAGTPVTGRRIEVDRPDPLIYTPAPGESGSRYAVLNYTRFPSATTGKLVIDVGHRVRVPMSEVDPEGADDAQADLGPARVPVLLRLSHYARKLAECESAGEPGPELSDYLGRDDDSRQWHDSDPDARNALLRGCLREGRALVVLDGLDELPEDNHRTVSLQIQKLIEDWTRPHPTDGSDLPGLSGGNQIVVTSRYVGYKFMPVRGRCAHFGIQPMARPAVEQFVRSWTAAVNAEMGAAVPTVFSAKSLIDEIYAPGRPAVRDLATNPLLLTILATVYWADGRLPDQRAEVYERLVDNLLRIWLARPECVQHGLTRDELLAALEPLAADLQDDRRGNGLVSLERIGEVIEAPLVAMRRTTPDDRRFRTVLKALLETIGGQVGLLAEQSKGNYAFFHRTFQEFLAARHLLADRQRAAAAILDRLDDPRWREPLLLAVGLAMSSREWGPDTRTRLLADLLAADLDDPLIPRAAMLVVEALPGLGGVPEPVVARVVRRLLHCFASSQDQPQAAGLRDGVRAAFSSLRAGPQAHVVTEVVAETIRQPLDGTDLSGAAADVIHRTGWFTTATVKALLQASARDRTELGWPILWALVEGFGGSGGVARVQTAPLAGLLPMRRLLEGSPELADFVRSDTDWLWLLIALYGGLDRPEVGESLRRYQSRRLRSLRQAAPGAPVDSTVEPVGASPAGPRIEFRPSLIVRDLAASDLRRQIVQQLRNRRPAVGLEPALRRVWELGDTPHARAEGLIGLAALGIDIDPLLRHALADPGRRPAAQSAMWMLRRLRALIREPIAAVAEVAARTVPAAAPEQHQIDLLHLAIEARVAAGGGPLAVGDLVPSHRLAGAVSAPARDTLAAEFWAYLFSGLADEPPDRLAEALESATTGPDAVGFGWTALARARNHGGSLRLSWPQPYLVPYGHSPADRYLSMLDAMQSAPAELDHLAGYLTGRRMRVVEAEPALFWETLAVTLLRGRRFRTGFLAGATGTRMVMSQYGPAGSDAVTAWARAFGERRHERGLETALKDIFVPDHETAEDVLNWGSTIVLLRHAVRIPHPYLRFRALWRLADVFGAEHLERLGVDLALLTAQIPEPHDLARAREWLIMSMPIRSGGPAFDTVIDSGSFTATTDDIADPDDRARAQARLAMIAPTRLVERIRVAVASAEQIEDSDRRAETLAELRAIFGAVPERAAWFDAAAAGFTDTWLRDKVRGRFSRLIHTYRSSYRAPVLAWRMAPAHRPTGSDVCRLNGPTGRLAWGLLYLDAVAVEAEVVAQTPDSGTDRWELLSQQASPEAVDGLLDAAVDGMLQVTAREASLLGPIVRSGRDAVLEPLWPALECTDSTALAMVRRWSGAAPATRRWQALVQAEAGRLTPEIIDLVVELATEAPDRLRLRAGLGLHGRTPYARNRDRRWQVQRVGSAAIESLARHAQRVDCPPAVLTSLAWVRSDIHHDDADAIGAWLRQAAADEHSPAAWILESLESIEPQPAALLPPAIATAPPALQRILVVALAKLSNCGTVFNQSPQKEAVRDALAAVPGEVRRQVRALPDGPKTFLQAAGQATDLDDLRGIVDQNLIWVDEVSLSDADSCLKRLREIGYRQYVTIGYGNYWIQAGRAAEEVAERDDVLRLLVDLVAADLLDGDTGKVDGHLLTALQALASLSPPAFATMADPDTWEPMLIEVAGSADHWNARLAAVRLLGLLRRNSDQVVTMLRSAIIDVSFVQQAAYEAVDDFRFVDGDVIPGLLDLLDDDSAAVVAVTARLLVRVANAEGATADRRLVLRSLRTAVARQDRRLVFLMEDVDVQDQMKITLVDPLSRILDRAVFEVSGL